jgi:hypothetical protein
VGLAVGMVGIFGQRQQPMIRLLALKAEGQDVWTSPSARLTGQRLVSFLVPYMFVNLRLLPSTTGL